MNLVGPSEFHPLSPKQTSPFPDRFTDEARPQMERRGKWGSPSSTFLLYFALISISICRKIESESFLDFSLF
ncbi:hypothetical protein SDJN03_15302, partial [Cucurbita argyrosperma subsp. sororia]